MDDSSKSASEISANDASAIAPVTLDDLKQIIDMQTKTIEEKLSSQLGCLRAEISGLVSTVQNISLDVTDLKERTLGLENTYDKLSERQEVVAAAVGDLQEEVRVIEKRYEEELDKLEAFSRRDNLRFFGLPESQNETFETCAEKVVEVLQGTVPNKVWCVGDVVRAHRIGKRPTFASGAANRAHKPRPMIVKFTRWRDKMDILTKGRAALKPKGVDVAGDLTNRQQEEIRRYRDDGIHAYYKGNKLVVAGPLQQRNADDNNARYNHCHRDGADSHMQQRRYRNWGRESLATSEATQLNAPRTPAGGPRQGGSGADRSGQTHQIQSQQSGNHGKATPRGSNVNHRQAGSQQSKITDHVSRVDTSSPRQGPLNRLQERSQSSKRLRVASSPDSPSSPELMEAAAGSDV